MSCQQVPTTPAFNLYPRSVQVGEFEVAIDGGIWVAIRVKRSAHTSVAQLEQSIREYIDRHNQDPKPFVWHKSADTILASVARAASSII